MKHKREIPFMGHLLSILVLTEPFFWRKLISIYKRKEKNIFQVIYQDLLINFMCDVTTY